jgi:hypothetical protein
MPKTQPFAFSADEGADVGRDDEKNESNDYKQADNSFTGKIFKVTIDTKPSGMSSTDEKEVKAAEMETAVGED